jgi:hypothetical protein
MRRTPSDPVLALRREEVKLYRRRQKTQRTKKTALKHQGARLRRAIEQNTCRTVTQNKSFVTPTLWTQVLREYGL